MKTTKKEECKPCQRSFGDKVREIVDDVKNYTRKEYRNRKREVEAAFSSDDQHKIKDAVAHQVHKAEAVITAEVHKVERAASKCGSRSGCSTKAKGASTSATKTKGCPTAKK